MFVRHAQRILNDMQALAERMEDYAANRSGRVRIGALPIMCALHIPELIGGFHRVPKYYPDFAGTGKCGAAPGAGTE
ncbi:MAG: hypothetical protein ACLRWQ_03830 [Flavonifractor plautii]